MCYTLGVRWLLIVILAAAAAGCDKPDYESCRELCWRYAELEFWEKFETETADMTPKEKASARAEREQLWNEMKNREVNPGLENCVTACRQGGTKADVACVKRAETAAQARACKLGE